MVLQHNLSAMNTSRMFNVNTEKMAAAAEKLSSGYRINRSADDAAGLSISEKMRYQIRGLKQASRNAQDGISLVQTADGAMAEVHEMIRRAGELSVQAANDTLTDLDRANIQQEIEQIKEEIDGIGDRTTFNGIQILKGKDVPPSQVKGDVIVKGSMPSWVVMGSTDNLNEEYVTEQEYVLNDGSTGKMNVTHSTATIDFSGFTEDKIEDLVGNGFYTTCCTCDNHYSIKFTDETSNSVETSGSHYIYNIGIKGVKTPEELIKKIIQGTDNGHPRGHYTKLKMDTNKTTLIVYDDRAKDAKPANSSDIKSWTNWSYPQFGVVASGNLGKFGPGTAYSAQDTKMYRNADSLTLQIGARQGQTLQLEMASISTGALGIKSADVSTTSGAQDAIDIFKDAMEYVSSERSRMGAYQNRLEHTIASLDNVAENTQAAESKIRDTDMADMMVEYSKSNILTQVGQSLMAQANQMNQGVLQLLQ